MGVHAIANAFQFPSASWRDSVRNTERGRHREIVNQFFAEQKEDDSICSEYNGASISKSSLEQMLTDLGYSCATIDLDILDDLGIPHTQSRFTLREVEKYVELAQSRERVSTTH